MPEVVVGISNPTHKHFVSTISTHNNLKGKIDLQSERDVHEIFHSSQPNFDCTHDSLHEGPIDQCETDNGTLTKSEPKSDEESHLVELNHDQHKELEMKIVELAKDVPTLDTMTFVTSIRGCCRSDCGGQSMQPQVGRDKSYKCATFATLAYTESIWGEEFETFSPTPS